MSETRPIDPRKRADHLPPPWGSDERRRGGREVPVDHVCPVCGHAATGRKCKVICPNCRTLIMNCSEF